MCFSCNLKHSEIHKRRGFQELLMKNGNKNWTLTVLKAELIKSQKADVLNQKLLSVEHTQRCSSSDEPILWECG